MSNELTVILPESLEVANTYLQYGNVKAVAMHLGLAQNVIVDHITKPEVKRYLDTVYLDLGYRNRDNIASIMDTIISDKMAAAEETGMYTKKDIVELLEIAHKMRMDEIKAMQAREDKQEKIKNQTNIQINETSAYGQGNYGKLMERLLNSDVE